jgi:cyclopropane fatty-acyl-phospholipid synthase-like methyltransferase
LAEGERERLPDLCDLPRSLRKTGAATEARDLKLPEYVAKMDEKPEWADRFTRMLYELHKPLADHLAESLDLTDVDRILDLGGGSGVISLSLLCRNPQLTAVVVDIASVCSAGRTIAAEHSLEEGRIVYHAANFLQDDLPSGFDMVLECDVNTYSVALFHKVWNALNLGGRFLIVDQLSPAPGVAPFSRLHWAFQNSLEDPEFCYPTAAEIKTQLIGVGFQIRSVESLPPISVPSQRFTSGLTMIEARK